MDGNEPDHCYWEAGHCAEEKDSLQSADRKEPRIHELENKRGKLLGAGIVPEVCQRNSMAEKEEMCHISSDGGGESETLLPPEARSEGLPFSGASWLNVWLN